MYKVVAILNGVETVLAEVATAQEAHKLANTVVVGSK